MSELHELLTETLDFLYIWGFTETSINHQTTNIFFILNLFNRSDTDRSPSISSTCDFRDVSQSKLDYWLLRYRNQNTEHFGFVHICGQSHPVFY